jgi:hypothetical protein
MKLRVTPLSGLYSKIRICSSPFTSRFFVAKQDERRSQGSLSRGRRENQQTCCEHITFFTLHAVNEAIQATALGISNQDCVRYTPQHESGWKGPSDGLEPLGRKISYTQN